MPESIYINDQEITYEPMHEPDVLRIGDSIWRARYGGGGKIA